MNAKKAIAFLIIIGGLTLFFAFLVTYETTKTQRAMEEQNKKDAQNIDTDCNVTSSENTFKDFASASKNPEDVCYLILTGAEGVGADIDFGMFSNLVYLDIKQYKGTEFPKGIEKLPHLKFLYLNNSSITTLPKNIENLAGLTRLSLISSTLTPVQLTELQKMLPKTTITVSP